MSAVRSEAPGGSSTTGFEAFRLESSEGRQIAERDGDEDVRRRLDQRPREVELDRRFHRHVEQEQRERAIRAGGFRRGLEQRAAICCGRGGELVLESLEQAGEVRSAERQRRQRPRVDPGEHELVQRACERARKARGSGHRAEVVEPAVAGRFERRPRRDRFAADIRDRRDASRGEHGRGQPRRELRHAESMEADCAAAGHGHGAREVVGSPAGRGHDEHAGAVGASGDPRVGL